MGKKERAKTTHSDCTCIPLPTFVRFMPGSGAKEALLCFSGAVIADMR